MVRDALLILGASIPLLRPAHAAPNIQTIDVPGQPKTYITAINDAGVTAGTALSYQNAEEGFIRTADGTITTFTATDSTNSTWLSGLNAEGDTVGSFGTNDAGFCFMRSAAGSIIIFGDTTGPKPECGANAINDKGFIVGKQTRSSHPGYCFLRTPTGGMQHFLKGTTSAANGLNREHVVVGATSSGTPSAFARNRAGLVTNFIPKGADGAGAVGINDKGEIVGYVFYGPGIEGFVQEPDGTVTYFAVPQSAQTQPAAINNKGEVTGQASGPDGGEIGFLRKADGHIVIINAPESGDSIFPTSVNNSGVVAGYYSDSVTTHGFIRTP